jgi:hypothetical protein
MCEECEEAEPFYVAYFAKAGGGLWRPPQTYSVMQPIPDATDRLRADQRLGPQEQLTCEGLVVETSDERPTDVPRL